MARPVGGSFQILESGIQNHRNVFGPTEGTLQPAPETPRTFESATFWPSIVPGATGAGGETVRSPSPMVEFPPTPNITDKERKDEENAWTGTVTMVNQEKKFGFLKADNGLPNEYKGDSLFFHFNVVKNSSEKTVKIGQGTKAKFVLYKAKEEDTEPLERPKAFAVFTIEQIKKQECIQKTDNSKPKSVPYSVAQDVRTKLAARNTPPLKVSIFWDIENCRPKMNTILDVVANIRNLVLQGNQVGL